MMNNNDAIANPLIKSKSKIGLLKMIRVQKKPHPIHEHHMMKTMRTMTMMMTIVMMKIFTYSLIESKPKVELFEMIRVNKKPHPIHPTKLLLWHKDYVHL